MMIVRAGTDGRGRRGRVPDGRGRSGAVTSVLAAGFVLGCGIPTETGSPGRAVGILQVEFGEMPMEAPASVVSSPDSTIRWDPEPGPGMDIPPEVIVAPDTVRIGEPFTVRVHTVGPNGCWSADGIDGVEGDGVIELIPWDLHSGAEACTMIFGYLGHDAELRLDRAGPWILRVRGRRVRGEETVDSSVTAERTVIVRPEVSLAPGEEVVVGAAFAVRFEGVLADSRCPADAMCVWQGDAAVSVRITPAGKPPRTVTLHTAVEPTGVDEGGWRIRLIGLSPYPFLGQPTVPGDYRVLLAVEPAP